MTTLALKVKKACLTKEASDAKEATLALNVLVTKATAFEAVAGLIPESVIDAVESALRWLVPLTSFLGDFELSGLLNSLKLWLDKKKIEIEDQKRQDSEMTQLQYSDFWTTY